MVIVWVCVSVWLAARTCQAIVGVAQAKPVPGIWLSVASTVSVSRSQVGEARIRSWEDERQSNKVAEVQKLSSRAARDTLILFEYPLHYCTWCSCTTVH